MVMSFCGKYRKGQFFLVGAIMIVIILHMLSTTLYKGTKVEFSVVQDNNPIWTVEEAEKGLYEIAKKDLTDTSEIDEFVQMQKEVARENGYVLWFDLVFRPYYDANFPVYSISLESKDFYILKEGRLLPYYSLCDAGTVCVPSNIGYSNVCCKAYGLCC
ncbi:MAG: hypothetical protein ABIG84_00050 [archaeon]